MSFLSPLTGLLVLASAARGLRPWLLAFAAPRLKSRFLKTGSPPESMQAQVRRVSKAIL